MEQTPQKNAPRESFAVPLCPTAHATRSAGHFWDAEQVGAAIVQAFVTLEMLPKVRVPRGPGSNWPGILIEWGDLLGLDPIERKMREEAANKVKIYPSALEISRMEMAFDWLRMLRREDTAMATIVTYWALRTAQGRTIRRLCLEKGWAPRTFWRKRAKALEWLAARLNARAVSVF